MTSAARPTFDHAKGKEKSVVSSIQHKKALVSHSKLKLRTGKSRKHEEFEEAEENEENDEETGDGRKLPGVSNTQVVILRKDIESEDNSDANESEFSDEDDVDEEELLREMELIKQERANSGVENSQKQKESNVAVDSGKISKPAKKSWRSSKTMNKGKTLSDKDRFSNNTLKSDFHQDFLNKYVKQ